MAGILLIDIGMQCIQLSNQTSIFHLCPAASNRLNTIFMTTYFIGGSLGHFPGRQLLGIVGMGWRVGHGFPADARRPKHHGRHTKIIARQGTAGSAARLILPYT